MMDDTISRQVAIDKIDCLYRDTAKNESYMITGYNHAVSDVLAIIKSLPSAQPKLAQDLPNACTDTISRQEAIYLANIFSSPSNIAKALAMLPDAQSEIIHCRDCKWHNGEINQCNAQICASMCVDDFCSKGERRKDG